MPLAVVPPQPRPVAGQLPRALEAQGAAPTETASIIGPLVGAEGSLHELVQRKQPQGWRESGAKQPPLPPPLSPEEVAAKLGGTPLHNVVLCCPSCNTLLAAKLPPGLTQVRCDACSAAPLHAPVAPPKEKKTPGRRNPSHHGPPRNQNRVGRQPTNYNKWQQQRVPERQAQAKAAGASETSQESFTLSAQEWPTVRDAAAVLSGGPRTANATQPRRSRAPATRAPPRPPLQPTGAPGRSHFYHDVSSSDEEDEEAQRAAAALRRARSSAARGTAAAAAAMPRDATMSEAEPPPSATAPAEEEPAAAAATAPSAAPASPHAGQIRKDHGGKADSASRPSKAGTRVTGPQCQMAHVMQYGLVNQSGLGCDRCETVIAVGENARWRTAACRAILTRASHVHTSLSAGVRHVKCFETFKVFGLGPV